MNGSDVHVISDPESFWLEAQYQRVCAICGSAKGPTDFRGRGWHAHHVIPRQRLRRMHLPEYDPRGALRLCTRCHMQYEWAGPGKIQIATERLVDINICYIWDVLKLAGRNLLVSSYTGPDERWERHERGVCHLCQ